MRRLFIFLLFVTMLATGAQAQVAISPTTVFIGNNNFGSFLVMNNSNQAQEIAVEFLFGYSVSDSLGNATMNFVEEGEIADLKSINPYIRSFPRTFILEPGQRQTVRLTVRPPADMADGTYWTRVKIRSNPRTAVIQQSESGGVGTQINFIFEQVLGTYYKKGVVNTGVVLNSAESVLVNDNYLLVYDFSLSGNSPFIGTVSVKVKDASGKDVYDDFVSTTLLLSGKRNFTIPVKDLTPGMYSVTFTFESNRRDIPEADRIPMERVQRTVQVRF